MTIEKIKTLYGQRYAIVEEFTSTTKKEGKMVTTKHKHAIEYKSGDTVKLAHFPVTAEGLEEAKSVMKQLKK